MSDIVKSEGLVETEKPATTPTDEVKFPPFPEPTDKDFEDDVPEEERNYYKKKFPDLNDVRYMRLHCTSCDRHLGSSARNVSRMRPHPMLRTLVCHTCHTFYNSGEFEKGEDGSELYCRWCGQGGQVYCCSSCPHVFCAKCIKRNLGPAKIKEIESTDDWKCFKCMPECLKEHRALCWATLRYCDLKNEITYKTEDPKLREVYQKDSAQDYTECCRNKGRKKEKETKKKPIEKATDLQTRKQTAASVISKIPSTIQVKKFASINADEIVKPEKKAIKRPASPRSSGFYIKNPIAIASGPRILNPVCLPTPAKKSKMPNPSIINAVRFVNDTRPMATYSRPKPRPPMCSLPMISNFNGFSNVRPISNVNMVTSDNINLSLESLTQGLDMAAMAAMSNNLQNDDVVCTPDFPMEPLCEVTEDNDDDVQCISPDPVLNCKNKNPPSLVPRNSSSVLDMPSENIIQMTEHDVTVNLATGGLKFRVDPQTLSSNKMYRLPDGRVFAIKANPNMPGGYSATIVAVTENAKSKAPRGATYAAKLSTVSNVSSSTPNILKTRGHNRNTITKRNNNLPKRKTTPANDTTDRECDLSVPVEWYRYNLIDAVDALEYSLSRLHKLKNEATSMFLRTRNINEMRNMHRNLERLLNTSSKRFTEIRENLNKELKQYILKKKGEHNISEDDDDDVEILPDLENDDPIFIDENSVDSSVNINESQEVDLTETGNSENNDSGEKADSSRLQIDPLVEDDNSTIVNSSDELGLSMSFINNAREKNLNETKTDTDDNNAKQNNQTDFVDNTQNAPINTDDCLSGNEVHVSDNQSTENKQCSNEKESSGNVKEEHNGQHHSVDIKEEMNENVCRNEFKQDSEDRVSFVDSNYDSNGKEKSEDLKKELIENELLDDDSKEINNVNDDNSEEKMQEAEMSSELIEKLLKDDNEIDTDNISGCLDIPDLQNT